MHSSRIRSIQLGDVIRRDCTCRERNNQKVLFSSNYAAFLVNSKCHTCVQVQGLSWEYCTHLGWMPGFPCWIWTKQRLCSWLIIRSWAIKIHPVNCRKWRTFVRNGECATGRAQETHFHLLSSSCAGSDGRVLDKGGEEVMGASIFQGAHQLII